MDNKKLIISFAISLHLIQLGLVIQEGSALASIQEISSSRSPKSPGRFKNVVLQVIKTKKSVNSNSPAESHQKRPSLRGLVEHLNECRRQDAQKHGIPFVEIKAPKSTNGKNTEAEAKKYIMNELVTTEKTFSHSLKVLTSVAPGGKNIFEKLADEQFKRAAILNSKLKSFKQYPYFHRSDINRTNKELENANKEYKILLDAKNAHNEGRSLSRATIDKLENSGDPNEKISSVFSADNLKNMASLNLMTRYQPVVAKHIEMLKKSDPAYLEAWNKKEAEIATTNNRPSQGIDSHLITPAQRGPRYELFLRDFHKHTADENVEVKAKLGNSLSNVNEFMKKMNKDMSDDKKPKLD
jgi:hypothetical protein